MANSEVPIHQREFHCVHCTGKIRIPKDLPPTTGPCPHCGGTITSPALESTPASAFQIPLPTLTSAIPTQAQVQPIPLPPVEIAQPQPPTLRPEQVISKAIIPPPRQELRQNPEPAPQSPAASIKEKPAPEEAKPQRSGLVSVMVVLLLLFLGAGVAVFIVSKELGREHVPKKIELPLADPAITEANYLRIGWQKDAYQLLRNYMAATTSQQKLPFVLNSQALAPKIDDFYGGSVIIDSDTPADAFSVYELSEEDRKRGLFMMVYDQPPQFEMKEFFRPLASLEVQYGIDEADLLLSTLARVGNFAMEPLRVHAFFKRSPEGLKLDWEIFAQTKYRTFQNFTELPEIGDVGVFRVFVVEDVPEKGRAVPGTRTYRLVDPANISDTTRVNVKVDSDVGRDLSIINWRGTKEDHAITRTATVELTWTGEDSKPELEISRFICWEFLGLGGEEKSPASTKK